MAKWTEPITDRTNDDLLNRVSKAFFNVADWVRINGNASIVNALVNVMLSLNIPFEELREPTIGTIPTVEEINTFIENIEVLRVAASFSTNDAPPLKTDYVSGNGAIAPDYEDVNDWETNLSIIREFLRLSAEDLIYCGVSTCGQNRVWAARFHTWGAYVQDAVSPTRKPRCGPASIGSGLTRQNYFRRY